MCLLRVYLELNFCKCGVGHLGAKLRAMLTNQEFQIYRPCEASNCSQHLLIFVGADEILDLLLTIWFLLILYQSNLKLNVCILRNGWVSVMVGALGGGNCKFRISVAEESLRNVFFQQTLLL